MKFHAALLSLALPVLVAGCAGSGHSLQTLTGAELIVTNTGAPGAVAPPMTPATNAAILAAGPGESVLLPEYPLEVFPEIPYRRTTLESPQYIISDSPEYIRIPEGAALRERVVPGTVRLYVYNVNGVREPEFEKMPRKITTIIRNLGTGDLNVRFTNYAFPPPSGNYFKIGKDGLRDFMSGTVPPGIDLVIPAGDAAPLDARMEKSIINFDDLVHGFYQFTVDQPAEITVLQTAPDEDGVVANARITEVIPPKTKSGAGRGLFPVSNYRIDLIPGQVLSTADGARQLIIADGRNDPWIEGRDGDTGELAVNKGNYGVMYDIDFEWTSPDGKALALLTWNARHESSQWCGGMALSMIVSAGLHPAGIVQVPSNELILRKPPQAAVVQVFLPPPPGETGRITLRYSPPGASCLPTPLIFVPVELPAGN
jgi:hypothetical protein